MLQKTREPFNTNGLAQTGAVAALADDAHQAETKRLTDEGRKYLENEFAAHEFALRSQRREFRPRARRRRPGALQEAPSQGLIVRALSGYNLPEWVRISIGTMEQNRKCIAALREVLAA